MSDPTNINIDVGPPPEILRPRGSFRFLKILVLLAVIAGSGVVIWLNRDRFSDSSKTETAEGGVSSQAGSASDSSGSSTRDTTSASQQNAAAIRSLTDSMAAQQADIRKLSDRMDDLANRMASLTSKVYLLQAGDPGAATPSTAAPAAPAPARAPVAAAPKKKPAPPPKPAGAISVGGAPLPSAPER